MYDLWDFTKEVIFPTTGFLIFLIVGVTLVVNSLARYSCNRHQDITGIETRYVNLTACYLNTENGWMSYDEYKQRNIARIGLSKMVEEK